jgi:hypothetical protein
LCRNGNTSRANITSGNHIHGYTAFQPLPNNCGAWKKIANVSLELRAAAARKKAAISQPTMPPCSKCGSSDLHSLCIVWNHTGAIQRTRGPLGGPDVLVCLGLLWSI